MSSAVQSPESCPGKDCPTTPPSGRQATFTSRLERAALSLRDLELPGLGEPGEVCGTDRLPEKDAICPNGDAVRYEPNRCRRVACPDCYASEDRERAFQLAVRIEGLARLRGERPHGLAWSVREEEAKHYSIKDINTKLMRRGRRRSKRKSAVLGGISIVHPARLRPDRADGLRDRGFGSGDGGHGELGLWKGVRADALELGDWRAYARYWPHGHSIGFPERIEPHEGDEFIVNKYDTFQGVKNVVNHLEYLMHHRSVWRGDGEFKAIRPWGLMHHASADYVDVEEELDQEEYAELCQEVAAELGGEWSADEGLHYLDEGEPACPECGKPKSDFIDLWELPRLAASKKSATGGQWIRRLSDSQQAFFKEIIEILNHDQQPRIERGDVIHPDDVAVWIDVDRPPP